jgi:hypothetical protein
MTLKSLCRLSYALLFSIILSAVGCSGNSSSGMNASGRVQASNSTASLGVPQDFEGFVALVESNGEHYLLPFPTSIEENSPVVGDPPQDLSGFAPVSSNTKGRKGFIAYHVPETQTLKLYSVQKQEYVFEETSVAPDFDMDDYYLSYQLVDGSGDSSFVVIRLDDLTQVTLNRVTTSDPIVQVSLGNDGSIFIFRELVGTFGRTLGVMVLQPRNIFTYSNIYKAEYLKFVARIGNSGHALIGRLKNIASSADPSFGNLELLFLNKDGHPGTGMTLPEGTSTSAHISFKMNKKYLVYLREDGFNFGSLEKDSDSGFGSAMVYHLDAKEHRTEQGIKIENKYENIKRVHSSFGLYGNYLFYASDFIADDSQASVMATIVIRNLSKISKGDGCDDSAETKFSKLVNFKIKKVFFLSAGKEVSDFFNRDEEDLSGGNRERAKRATLLTSLTPENDSDEDNSGTSSPLMVGSPRK